LRKAGIFRGLVGGAAVVSSLLGAGSAQAVSQDLGTVNGLNYRVMATTIDSGTGLDSYADCGDGDIAIGGGIDIADDEDTNVGIAEGATMGSTYPDTDAGVSVWRTSALNESGGSLETAFYAICSEPADVLARKNKTRVGPGSRGKVRAACPTGYEVAGGGIRSAGPTLATVPYDDDDKNKKPDDGWRASSYNGGGERISLTAFASCVRARDWGLTYLRSGAATQAGHTVHSGILCPEGDALAGLGAKARGGEGPHDISIRELYPQNDFLPEEDAPSEAMAAGMGAQSDAIAGMSVSGICRS